MGSGAAGQPWIYFVVTESYSQRSLLYVLHVSQQAGSVQCSSTHWNTSHTLLELPLSSHITWLCVKWSQARHSWGSAAAHPALVVGKEKSKFWLQEKMEKKIEDKWGKHIVQLLCCDAECWVQVILGHSLYCVLLAQSQLCNKLQTV